MAFQIHSVLISDDIDGVCPQILRENGINVTEKSKLTADQLKAELQHHDTLIVRSATKVTKEVLQAASALKLVGRAGTGVDNIDVVQATKQGIVVMNTPAGNSRSAAELTCSMILNLSRKVPQAHQSMKEGRWDRKNFMGSEVSGKTLAVIGLGRIGREAAIRMQAFGMRTIGFDPLVSAADAKEFGVEWLSLEEIWPIADYITFHVPLIPQTKDLINTETFSKTRPGVCLINCARGGIINEADLLKALESGVCGGVALDVFCEEPPADRALIDHPNVISTPHLGASTKEAQFRVAEEIAQQIVWLNQGRLEGTINARPLAAALDKSKMSWIRAVEDLSAILHAIGETEGLKNVKNVTVEFPKGCVGMEPAFKAACVIGMLKKSSSNGLNLINADAYGKAAGITVFTEKGSENRITVSVEGIDRISGVPSEAGTIVQEIESYKFHTGLLCRGTAVLYKNGDASKATQEGFIGGQKLGEKFIGFAKSGTISGQSWVAQSFEKLTNGERANNFTSRHAVVDF